MPSRLGPRICGQSARPGTAAKANTQAPIARAKTLPCRLLETALLLDDLPRPFLRWRGDRNRRKMPASAAAGPQRLDGLVP